MTTKFPVPTNHRTNAPSTDSPAHSAAFQDCFTRYQECLELRSLESSSPLMEECESYILDFEIAAKRSLGADAQKQQIFRQLYLENRSAEDCCRSLKMDRFSLAKASKQVQGLLGSALIQRGLFPLNKYFTRATAALSDTRSGLEQVAA